jgi:hypothetical protein
MWDLLEPDSPDSQVDSVSQDTLDHCFMSVSEAAIAGTEGPKTFKI